MDTTEGRDRNWASYANGDSMARMAIPLVRRREDDAGRDSCAAVSGGVGPLPPVAARRDYFVGSFKPSESSFASGPSFPMSSRKTSTTFPPVASESERFQHGEAGGVNPPGTFNPYEARRQSLLEPKVSYVGKRDQMEEGRDRLFQKPSLQPISAPTSKLPSIHEALGYTAQFPSPIYRNSGPHSLPPSPLAGTNGKGAAQLSSGGTSNPFPLLHGHNVSSRRQDLAESKRLSVSSFRTEESQAGSVSSFGSSLKSPGRSRRSTAATLPTPVTTSPRGYARPQSFPGQVQPCQNAHQGPVPAAYTWNFSAPPDDGTRQDVTMSDLPTEEQTTTSMVETPEIMVMLEANRIRPDAVPQPNFERLMHLHHQTCDFMMRVRNTRLAYPVDEAKRQQIVPSHQVRPSTFYENRTYGFNYQEEARKTPTYPATTTTMTTTTTTTVPAVAPPYQVSEIKRRPPLAPRQRRTVRPARSDRVEITDDANSQM
ncbi:hypothetical protein KEM54_006872 [Ascosphaera aggregata]|nr:hypothetical protein KEM54_006872 [Ascosphaera aggregata]